MGLANNFRARSLITKQHRLTLYEGAIGVNSTISPPIHTSSTIFGMNRSTETLRHDLTEQLASKLMELADTSPLATHHGP